METLYPCLGIDEAASGFSEWRDGQQHITEVHIGFESRKGNNHFFFGQRFDCLRALSAVKQRLVVEQKHGFELGRMQHGLGMHAVLQRHGRSDLRTNRVRSLA